jgi:4-hydroxy-tetrahydrodipicolinate reductase
MRYAAAKRAIIWGFGKLGREIARAIAARPADRLEIVAIVDTSKLLCGRAAAELVPGLGADLRIVASLAEAPPADIIFHGTETTVAIVEPQLLEALALGCDVITAAEWMFHPWLLHADVAGRIDEAARRVGRRIMGCGINPGFAFDTLPLVFGRTLAGITSIEMLRISNVSGSGTDGFKHVGLALSEAEFRSRLADGSVKGHIGFPESIAAIAERLGMGIDRIVERWDPILAVRVLELPQATINVGDVVAIRQEALAMRAGATCLSMVLEMHLDPEGYGRQPREEVVIDAGSRTVLTITPAPRSTLGAAAMMAGAALDIDLCPAGIVNFLDLPLGGIPRLEKRFIARDRTWQGQSVEIALGGSDWS